MKDLYSNIGFPVFDSVIHKLLDNRFNTIFPIFGFVSSDDYGFSVTLITKGFLNDFELRSINSLPSCCHYIILSRYEEFFKSECLVIQFIISRSDIPCHVH